MVDSHKGARIRTASLLYTPVDRSWDAGQGQTAGDGSTELRISGRDYQTRESHRPKRPPDTFVLSAPKSQRFLRDLRLRCPSRTPEIARFPRQCKGGRFVLPPPRGLPLGNSSRHQSCELTDCRNEPLCRVCVRCDPTTLSGLCPSRCEDFTELAKSSTKSLGFLHSVCTSSRRPRSRGGWGSGGAFGSLGAPLPEIDPQR